MRLRFRPVPCAVAAVFAAASLCGPLAWATGAMPVETAAQLAAMPTSPGFKMDVAKGPGGAPEPSGAVARAVEAKDVAASGAKAEAHAPAKAGAHAEPGRESAAEAHGEAGHAAKADAKADVPHEARPKDAEAAKDAAPDPMEVLRRKLAERLGAKPSPDGKFVMRVSTRGESGENVITAVRPGAGAVSHARRRPAARASASGNPEMNENVAAYAGNALLPTHWDYAGPIGPDAWSRLKPEFGRCANGTRQSPIDIRGGIAVELEPIQFDYRASAFSVVDDGHTVQVNVAPGNAITVTGKRYELTGFHFHRPSEERINGRQFDMVAHLEHKDAQGHLAVVAVLLDRGSAQPLVQTIWNNLPLEKGEEVRAGVKIDLAQLLPQDRRYYTYMGSMTTPPCSEGVLWMVMKQPVPISPEQVAIFARLYPMNARPIQQADGRLIKESN